MAMLADKSGGGARTSSNPRKAVADRATAAKSVPPRQPNKPPAPTGMVTKNGISARTFTPQPVQQSGGGGGGSFGGGGGGGGGYAPMSFGGGGDVGMAPAITAPTEEDYLAGDSGYQTEISALSSALQRFLADSDFQRGNYEKDYGQSLRDLGYTEGREGAPGQWNWNDKLTASGRGYQNQLDDFGSRGMLQSSGYADAFNELQRLLGQQYDALSGARTNFMTDMDNQTANYRAENTANQQAARAEALQRRAAQYAL